MKIIGLLSIVLVLGLTGCGGASDTAGQPNGERPTSSPQLTDLHSIQQLRTLFNAASTEPRLVVLVSPT